MLFKETCILFTPNELRKVMAVYEAHFYLIYKQCSDGFTDLVMTEFL